MRLMILLAVSGLWVVAGLIATNQLVRTGRTISPLSFFTGIGVIVGAAYAFYFTPGLQDNEGLPSWFVLVGTVVVIFAILMQRYDAALSKLKPRERQALRVTIMWLQSLCAALVGFMGCTLAILVVHRFG